jgi:hypothetical protein
MDEAEIKKLKDKTLQIFSEFGDVVGVGRTKHGIQVLFKEQPIGILPEEIDGVPVRIKVVGTIRAL